MDVVDGVRAAGYVLRRTEEVALKATFSLEQGMRVLILEGPPGVGKTALGRAVASAIGAAEVYFLCHHWVTEEDLFISVDVGRVAAGVRTPEEAYRPGALLRAVQASESGPVVLILDEVDKAPERVDALLLEFLQGGVVHGPRGERWLARQEHLTVFLTSNGTRPLSEPLLRRGMRVRLGFLPAEQEATLLRRLTGARKGECNLAVRAANTVRLHGASSPSLQELARLLESLRVAEGPGDVEVLLDGWLVKEDEDRAALKKEFGSVHQLASLLWGEHVR